MCNFPFRGEVVKGKNGIEQLGEIFDANSRQFLEDFTGNEVIARGFFFGLRWLMTAWVKRWIGSSSWYGVPKA
jgi:hypothetical protein